MSTPSNSTLNLNNPNKKIEFNIYLEDMFYTCKFPYFLSGSLIKTNGNNKPASSKIKLNFPLLRFRIEAQKYKKLIDDIE